MMNMFFVKKGWIYPIVIRTSPVLVVISHLPPVTVLGTLTSPVDVSTKNTLSDRRLPLTSPVLTFT